jgi:LPXTG-motif cell wall-anchored protein
MRKLFLVGIVFGVLLALTTAAPARADTYDRLAFMTFTGPVQVPGATLNAGTYRFRLANPDTSRNILQVLSHDGYSVYTTFFTTPDARVVTTDNPSVTFMETPAGVPPAVKSLFWGGEHRGFAFVYAKGEPIMTPKPIVQPRVSYTPNPVPAAPSAEPIPEPYPAAEPTAAEPEILVAEVAAAEPTATVPQELPKTATAVPTMALGGLTSLLAGLGIALLRRRVN